MGPPPSGFVHLLGWLRTRIDQVGLNTDHCATEDMCELPIRDRDRKLPRQPTFLPLLRSQTASGRTSSQRETDRRKFKLLFIILACCPRY